MWAAPQQTHTMLTPAQTDWTGSQNYEKRPMDKNRIEGAAKQVKGSVKEAIGRVTGDKSTELEGAAERTLARCSARPANSPTTCATRPSPPSNSFASALLLQVRQVVRM